MDDRAMHETATFLLAQVCRGLHRRVHCRLEELGLYRGQQGILHVLWQQEGRAHSELAEELRVSPATISNAVKRMERAGFVLRRPDPEDERISRVYLTDAGRAVRGAVEETWHELEERAFAGLDQEEQAAFRHALRRILENLMEASE